MIRILSRLLRSRSGVTAVEYGLIAALIAIVTIAGLTKLGTTLNSKYNTVATKVAAT